MKQAWSSSRWCQLVQSGRVHMLGQVSRQCWWQYSSAVIFLQGNKRIPTDDGVSRAGASGAHQHRSWQEEVWMRFYTVLVDYSAGILIVFLQRLWGFELVSPVKGSADCAPEAYSATARAAAPVGNVSATSSFSAPSTLSICIHSIHLSFSSP